MLHIPPEHQPVTRIDYPDSDLVFATLDPATQPATSPVALTVSRPWATPPSQARHQVHYELTDDPVPALLAHLDGHPINLDLPVRLEPVDVPKPWGREIWYSGIEARGESGVRCGHGTVPLLTYLSLAPGRLCGRQALVLLKILDPRPDPVIGELYFESHQVKREVYVVTDVSRELYPDGVGAIRLGMNQRLRASYQDDNAFRQAFLDAVVRYETAGRRLGSHADGAPAGDPALAAARAEEAAAREAVLPFCNTQALRVRDVVALPTQVPHALQPGVQVFELQTPSFERQIIWSSQKVLTQKHWDSAAAISAINLDLPDRMEPQQVDEHTQLLASFEDFSVWRVRLKSGESCPLGSSSSLLPAPLPYALCSVVSGCLELSTAHGRLRLDPKEAVFIPGSATNLSFACKAAGLRAGAGPGTGTDCEFLIAVPGR